MNGTQIIKQFYRMVLPASFRRAKIVQRFKSAITPHQILYDKTYYGAPLFLTVVATTERFEYPETRLKTVS
jgi:hypothetical protein